MRSAITKHEADTNSALLRAEEKLESWRREHNSSRSKTSEGNSVSPQPLRNLRPTTLLGGSGMVSLAAETLAESAPRLLSQSPERNLIATDGENAGAASSRQAKTLKQKSGSPYGMAGLAAEAFNE